MAKADNAFREAQKRIAEAARAGAKDLKLNIVGLTRIPQEIAGLTGITSLDLSLTQVADLTPLAGLTGIAMLALIGTQVADLTPLAGMTGIAAIYLSGTQVADLTPLAGLTGIATLDLFDTPVADLTPLAGMTGITNLVLRRTQVADLTPLEGLTGTATLYLTGTQVADLTPLAGMTGIKVLDLAATQVTDLGPIQAMAGLIVLDLTGAPVGKAQLRHLAGKPELVPERDSTGFSGVLLAGSAAAVADARIAEIAEIEGGRTRTLALFEYLGIEAGGGAGTQKVPPRRPAPFEVEVTDTAIALSGPGALPASDANARAAMGWESLKDYRDALGRGFATHNYQPLPGRLADFDHAMGTGYDPRRVIRIWQQGQRIQALTQDAEFMAMLPVGAAGDLRGFSAAISLYAERFPDVIAYRDDRDPDDMSPGNVKAAEGEFRAIDAIIQATPEAAEDVKTGVHEIVAEGTAKDADPEAARGLATSVAELGRESAEAVQRDKKARQKRNRDLADKGGDLVDDLLVKPLGLPHHFARKIEAPMRKLAARFPNRMGWIARWYDETFGGDDDAPPPP